MWISRKKLREQYTRALNFGYRSGFRIGYLNAISEITRALSEIGDAELLAKLSYYLKMNRRKTLAERQIEAILHKAEEEGKL